MRTATAQTQIVITNPSNLPQVTNTALPIGVVGESYPTTAMTATGGTGTGYTFTMSAPVGPSSGQTPPGLTLSPAGVLSGTPSASGNYPVQIQVTDSGNSVGSRIYDILVTNFSCPQAYADLGQPYSSAVGLSPFAASAYAITLGQLPAGLTLNPSSGLVSGTTNAAGTFNFTVTVTDTQARQVSKSCSITPQSVLQTTSARTTARVGVPYRSFIGAIGGQTGYSNSIISGSLPDGLTLESSTGRISGTPTTPGAVLARVRTQDSAGHSNDLALTIFVLARDFQPILRCSLPGVTLGQLYSSGLSLNSTLNPTYSISGSLPPGLSLNSATGQISGTASTPGFYSFTAIATGATSQPLTASCSISVVDSSIAPMHVACPDQNDMLVGEFYASPAIASGGKRPYTFSLSQGSLPSGLSLDPNSGLISGTLTALPPTFSSAPPSSGGPGFATQDFFYNLRVTDAGGFSAFTTSSCINTVSDTPLLSILTTSIPNAQLGSSYLAAIDFTGGLSPYTASFTGSLPSDLSLAIVGNQVRISGVLQQAGSFPFRLLVRDSYGQQAFRNYTITVTVSDPLRLVSSVLNGATVGVNYSAGIEAAGGSPPYRFSVTGGALPPGISLASDGTLRGSPTTSGTFRFDVEVADNAGSRVGRSLSIAVFQGNFRLGCPSLQAELGVPYNSQANVLGGSQPYSFYLADGQLPPGLNLDAVTGTIAGRPTTAGAFIFTFGVRDARQAQTQTACSIGVLGGALRILTEGPIQTKAAEPYLGQLDAAGGQAPYQWTLINAAPEAGLTVAANGSFTGKATRKGTFAATVQARDAVGATATKVISI
ncbi:MAG: Ig domain-containing protein, partial [Acidobacteria bacterium]|nr:Ig domain-containing protein [Acidobacteriota bacterium]